MTIDQRLPAPHLTKQTHINKHLVHSPMSFKLRWWWVEQWLWESAHISLYINPISLKIKQNKADANTSLGLGVFNEILEKMRKVNYGFWLHLLACWNGCLNLYVCGWDSKCKCKVEVLRRCINLWQFWSCFCFFKNFFFNYFILFLFVFKDERRGERHKRKEKRHIYPCF